MLECLILGDSIAVGVSQIRTECVAYAKSGINTKDYISKYGDKNLSGNTVIISLGSNDLRKSNSYPHLLELRSRVKATRVYWILPNEKLKPKQVEDIKSIAGFHKDIVIDRPTGNMSPDQVHPTYKGYKILADMAK